MSVFLFTGFDNKPAILTVQVKWNDLMKVFGLLLPMILFASLCFSQQTGKIIRLTDSKSDSGNLYSQGFYINDSIKVSVLSHVCKNSVLFVFYKKPLDAPITGLHKDLEHNSLLKIHGNVLYNFSYRSYLDTPFAQNDLVQNLIQTNLSFLIKNKYPITMTISNRNSNSSYFKNVTDVRMGYSRRVLLESIKEDLKKNTEILPDVSSLKKSEEVYNEHKWQAEQIQAWINSPARSQEIIEEKERSLNINTANRMRVDLPDFPKKGAGEFSELSETKRSLFTIKEGKGALPDIWKSFKSKSIDSANKLLRDDAKLQEVRPKKDSSCIEKINAKKQELAELLKELNSEGTLLKQGKKLLKDSIDLLKQQINGLNNSDELYAFMKRNGLSKDSISKAQKILLAIEEIGIGRTFIDYSELTVKNISLTGINIAANPGNLYYAAAAGKIDYLFRDFILKSDYSIPDQSLYLL
ncbi:MAG: hypothetical protein ACTHK0_18145, partial [Ginsengibacter sp.]